MNQGEEVSLESRRELSGTDYDEFKAKRAAVQFFMANAPPGQLLEVMESKLSCDRRQSQLLVRLLMPTDARGFLRGFYVAPFSSFCQLITHFANHVLRGDVSTAAVCAWQDIGKLASNIVCSS